MRLVGAVVAVTGGARGIGLACGHAFAAAGARVALGDLDGDLAAASGHVGLALDVRDEASCAAFFATIEERLGPVDVLVNSAGVALPAPFLDSPPAEQELQVAVNLAGVMRCLRLALPGMLQRGSGHVVTIASASGLMAAPGAAVYSATKHAVVGLTEAVRWELRGTGVHLCAVLPTVVATEMAAGLRTRGLPTVQPEAVAKVVLRCAGSRRPPATVLVPRWFRAIQLVDAVSPQWVRDAGRRVVRLGLESGYESERQRYGARVAQQLSATEGDGDQRADQGADDGGGVLDHGAGAERQPGA